MKCQKPLFIYESVEQKHEVGLAIKHFVGVEYFIALLSTDMVYYREP